MLQVFQSYSDGLRVSGQTFGLGNLHGGGAQLGEVVLAQSHHRHGAHEMMHAEGRSESGGAAGGHHMAGAGDVVAHYLRGKLTQEEAPGVFDLAGPGPRVGDHQAQVLRRDSIGQLYGLFQIIQHHRPPLPFQGLPGHFSPWRGGQLPVQLQFNLAEQFFRGGDQYRGGQRVVLRLRDQVGGAKAGLGGFIRDDNGLGGTKDPVDGHLALDQLLGVGHEHVAGAANLVNLGNRLGTVGHRGDGRHAPHLIEGIDSGDFRRHHYRRIQRLVASTRRGQDYFLNPGHPRRNSSHQNG